MKAFELKQLIREEIYKTLNIKGNFDSKKFLVKNNLTNNSKIISERRLALNPQDVEIVNKVASISKLECDISEQLLKVKKEILKIIEDLIAGQIVSKDRKELDLLYKQLQDLEEQFNLINNQLKNCTIKT